MNITSILITIVGIIIILALYVAGRVSQSKMPTKEVKLLPEIRDDNNNLVTSVLDDIPASDVSTLTKAATTDTKNSTNTNSLDKSESAKRKNKAHSTETKALNNNQLILFISAKNDKGLDGNLITTALMDNGLRLGENDIYHYYSEHSKQPSTSLFRVANGVEPWTLKQEDLTNKTLLGLSLVMLIPTKTNVEEALTVFLQKADTITKSINGVLKNEQQELLSAIDRKNLYKRYG